MTIRELVTKFSFKADLTALNKIDRKIGAVGRRMRTVGQSMSMYITAPLALAGVGILKVAGDFEMGMNRVQALTNATNDDFQKLRNQAKLLGKTTQFTAKQAADAQGFLAQAGFNVNQIYAAMPATLNLAGAAQQDMATTADQLSNIMQGFSMDANEAGRAADSLAYTATNSNTNITQLAEAMKYAAPVANLMGISLEKTAAMMGFMGNAGIQASMAGTSTRMALLQLVKAAPEATDALNELGVALYETGANGKQQMRDIFDILEDLEKAGAGTKHLEAIFGARGMAGIGTLLDQGIGNLRTFTTEIENSMGTAERISKTRMKGFYGALKKLVSALEGLAIAIADSGVLEWFTKMVDKLADFVRRIERTDPRLLKLAFTIGAIAAAMGPVLIMLGLMATGLSAISVASLPLIATIAGIAAAILGLILIIEDLYGWMHGKESLIGEWLGDWEDMSWGKLWDKFAEAAINAWSEIDGVVTKFIDGWLKQLIGLAPDDKWTVANVAKSIVRPANLPADVPTGWDMLLEVFQGKKSLKDYLFQDDPRVSRYYYPNGQLPNGAMIGGGTTTINVNVPPGTTPQDANAIARAVQDSLQRHQEKMLRDIQINTPTEE